MRGVPFADARIESRILRERVESDDRRAPKHLFKSALLVGRCVSVRSAAKLFECQSRFIGGGSRGVRYIFAKDGESFPECEGFEGKNEFCPGSTGDVSDETEISTQAPFFDDIGR